MMYCVVEFSDGIMLVPNRWIAKEIKSCSWPTDYDSFKFKQAVRNNVIANPTWKLCPYIRIMGYADTYAEGMKKLTRAEKESDLEKVTADERSYQCQNQRKRKKKSCIPDQASSSEEEENQDFLTENPLPELLKIPEIAIRDQTPKSQNQYGSQNQKRSFIQSGSGSVLTSPGENKVLHILAKLNYKIDTLQSTMDVILRRLDGPQAATDASTSSNGQDLLPKFPLETLQDVEELEAKLTDKNFRNILFLDLKKLGGRDLTYLVNNQLTHLFTVCLGEKFSYYGTKTKQAFSTLKLCGVMADVVRTQLSDKTNDSMKEPIQNWLRHCKEKLQKQSNCSKKKCA